MIIRHLFNQRNLKHRLLTIYDDNSSIKDMIDINDPYLYKLYESQMETWICNIKNNSNIKRIIHIYKDMDYDLETNQNVSCIKELFKKSKGSPEDISKVNISFVF